MALLEERASRVVVVVVVVLLRVLLHQEACLDLEVHHLWSHIGIAFCRQNLVEVPLSGDQRDA